MKLVKSNHRETLRNEHLKDSIRTAYITYCPEFRRLNKNLILINNAFAAFKFRYIILYCIDTTN